MVVLRAQSRESLSLLRKSLSGSQFYNADMCHNKVHNKDMWTSLCMCRDGLCFAAGTLSGIRIVMRHSACYCRLCPASPAGSGS